MSMYPRSSLSKRKEGQRAQKLHRRTLESSSREAKEIQQQLQDTLRHGLAVDNLLWSSKMTDWVVGLQTTDIDGDGNVEILLGLRDGWIRVFTPFGALKWEIHLEKQSISALAVIPLYVDAQERLPRIIVGLRDGRVIALDKGGNQVRDWEYQTERLVRQIAISESSPEHIVVGSEDRSVHVLDSKTGKLRWKYLTGGWVRCVFVKDIDGDGNDEILAGSGDKKLYIFNMQGKLLYAFNTGYRVYVLAAAKIEATGPISVFMSSSRKDIMAWQLDRSDAALWQHELLWHRSPKDKEPLFTNRIHAIAVKDIDNDGVAEVLAGSEDGHLAVLDRQGYLLWKQNFQSCIYGVHAADINYDGLTEVIVGTEDNSLSVFQLELNRRLYARIKELYSNAVHVSSLKMVADHLATRERALLNDFIVESPLRPQRMELEEAKRLMAEQKYEQALAIILRLLQQKVQYCWSQPLTDQHYFWTGYFGNITGGSNDEMMVGTEGGQVYAVDVSQESAKVIWSWSSDEENPDRIRSLWPGPTIQGHIPSIMVLLGNNRIVLLDQQGNLLKERVLEKDQNWTAHFSRRKGDTPGEIILGLEGKKVVFWSGDLATQTGQFATPEGIGAVHAYDLLGNGTDQIICGTLKNGVYTYTREGEELWHFETQDRVETLFATDIDKDGHPEIIVGSEDRNVYVLDYEGHLKWRYRTLRGIMDIDVCDIKMEDDPDDPDERPLKLLVSSNDNYLYMFNAVGDLVWKYQCPERARLVRVHDVNGDGSFEIGLASENQLELLQILKYEELRSLRYECWSKLTDDFQDRSFFRKLAEHPNEYIRGGALSTLAGIKKFDEEDFRYLQKALRGDASIQVKRELVRAAANLCLIAVYNKQSIHWARQLLEGLYHFPEEEIRLEILRYLPFLEEGLFFEYLERSAAYADIWVRRTVIRRLDTLVEQHHERVFHLLLKTVQDKEEWIRQESGRVLAHYIETHLEQGVSDLFTILDQGADLIVFEQMVYSITHPLLKNLFLNLLRQLTKVSTKNLAEILDEAVQSINALNKQGVFYGEEFLQMYEEFLQILSARTITSIAGYQRVTRTDILLDTPLARSVVSIPVLDAFAQAASVVATYERRQTVGERVSSLIEAQDILGKVRSYLRTPTPMPAQATPQNIKLFPEKHILLLLLDQWLAIINAELTRMRGSANLVLTLANTTVPSTEEVMVSLIMRNDGQCSADNVTIQLEENADFEIVGAREQKLVEISTKYPQSVSFVLRLCAVSARLVFHLTYDDAEKRSKTQAFADGVTVYDYHNPYHFIHNPYTTGTPIREKSMFYGRKEDLKFLRESLGSLFTNRVVLLWGQRRMGKTSLIYQLANELAAGQYAPVFIDLQDLALKDSSQLLEGFAQCVFKEILHYKAIRIAEPNPELFRADASGAFRDYLSSVWNWLPDHRLILLIDEFDGMNQHIARNGDTILYYLRSLMQHYPGLNFLLSGAPQMPYTEGYQSVLFNIAQSRKLGKLKPEEARELITEPIHPDLEYDPLALGKMISLTDGWPYFIHVLSEKLIEHCNAIQKSYVTISEINKALDMVLEEQSSSMRWIWQDLSSPTEKLVLSLLAQEKGDDGRVFTLNDIRRDFDEYGVQYVHKDVIEALSKLSRGDFVEEDFDGVQYRMPVGLIKAWLRKDKPPERVVREEKFFEDDLAS